MLNDSSPTLLKRSLSVNFCFYMKFFQRDDSVRGVPALFIGAINALFSIVAVTGNVLILASIWRNPSFRTPTYIFLAGLAATDFATGLITQPLYAAYALARYNDNKNMYCTLVTTLVVVSRYFANVTGATITVMAVERWLHMSRRSLITVRRAYFIYGAILFVPTPYIVARLWFISVKSTRELWDPLLIGIAGTGCFVTTSIAYFKVFQFLRRQKRQIEAHQSNQTVGHPAINLEKYTKSVYTVVYILGIFLICYVPNVICIVVVPAILKTVTWSSAIAYHISLTLIYMLSALNPLLYCWRIKEIRDEVKQLIKKIHCKG